MFVSRCRIASLALATLLVTLLGGRAAAFGAQGLTLPPNGENPQAAVTQAIGPVRVTIDYSSPRVVRGKNDRRGKIWGELVPYGMSDLGFNGCTSCPWRAGANENTVLSFSTPVTLGGQVVPAGDYGLHMLPTKGDWTVILSKESTAWGSFFYDQAKDAVRFTTRPQPAEFQEYLAYTFEQPTAAGVTLTLRWDKVSVPIPIALILELSLGVTWLMIETQIGSFRWVTHLSSNIVLKVRGST